MISIAGDQFGDYFDPSAVHTDDNVGGFEE